MGNDVGEMEQHLQRSSGRKVLGSLYGEVSNILEMIVPIIPIIEAARPGGKSGINELCLLNSEVEKVKLLLQHLAESSSFYLAMTGDAVILRCERRRNALHQSLSRILSMVADPLASKVAEIVLKLRSAKFSIDPAVEDAGRGILSVLQQSSPSEDTEFKAFCNASLKLDVISPRSRLLEKRCIKKLLDKFRGSDPQKETSVKYLLYLFRKYERRFVAEQLGQKAEEPRESASSVGENSNTSEVKEEVATMAEPSTDSPPQEFICPLSQELIRDPVVIASGETFERSAIAKWFAEGNDCCPRTGKKMTNLSMVPNTIMKSLISNWQEKREARVTELSAPTPESFQDPSLWNNSTSFSIASMRNIVPAASVQGRIADYDCSNVSILSTDAGYLSDSAAAPQFLPHIEEKFSSDFFLDLSEQAVTDLRARMQDEDEWRSMAAGGFLEALGRFLKESYHLSRMESLKIGSRLLAAFLEESRLEVSRIGEELYELMVSLLDSEVVSEAVMILQLISRNRSLLPATANVAIVPLIKTLASGSPSLQDGILEILCNLSGSVDGKLRVLTAARFSKVLSHVSFSCNWLKLLRRLCEVEEGKKMIAEADGCIAAIAALLESSDREEQALASAILLALCSSESEYCSLVMEEGVITPLMLISINGNSEGKESSRKLLHILRDFRVEDQEEEKVECVSFLPLEEPPLPPRPEQPAQRKMMEMRRPTERKKGFFGRMFQRTQALF